MRQVTIGEAARQAGVGVETIRFYERRRLVEQPPTAAGRRIRVYPAETIRRIRFIRQAQQLGFSLREIEELLALRADPNADCSKVRAQAIAKLHEVRNKIERLREIGAALAAVIAACPGQGGLQSCSILDRFATPIGRPQDDQQKEGAVNNVELKVEGMHCEGCAETIKAVVEREPGVKAAAVSFKAAEARILYDPTSTSAERIVAAVGRLGYRVTERSA